MKNKTAKTKTIVKERLKKINEAVEQLKSIREKDKDEYLSDIKLQYSSMYAMIIAIEAICDIGNHILAYYFNRAGDTYKDIILQLGKVGVIPEEFSQESASMVDFRNILIHLYIKVNEEKVYQYLQKAPEEFNKFSQYFLDFLED